MNSYSQDCKVVLMEIQISFFFFFCSVLASFFSPLCPDVVVVAVAVQTCEQLIWAHASCHNTPQLLEGTLELTVRGRAVRDSFSYQVSVKARGRRAGGGGRGGGSVGGGGGLIHLG